MSAGNRFVSIGDSITQGADAVYATNNDRAVSWPVYASVVSGQRLMLVRNAGIGGSTSTQAVARFDADVAQYRPAIVSIALGTNDTAIGVALPVFQANIMNLVNRVKALGSLPVLCAMPTNTTFSPTDRIAQLTRFNRWQRYYAAAEGIPFVDFHALLVNPNNGQWRTGYTANQTHPSSFGYAAMGKMFSDQIAPLLPAWTPPLVNDNSDPESTFIKQGCFTSDFDSDGIYDSWTGVLPSGAVASMVPGTYPVLGNWQKLTATATASIAQLYQQKACAPGARYAISGRISCGGMSANGTSVNMKHTVKTSAGATLATYYSLKTITEDIDSGVFYTEFVTPDNAGLVNTELNISAGTGWVQIAQVGAFNLNSMGLPGLLP